jgi:hypothetical protein
MVKWGFIYSKIEGEGWSSQNSETLVDPCQLPYMAGCDSYGKRVIQGICLKVVYAALTVAYAASKWHTPP